MIKSLIQQKIKALKLEQGQMSKYIKLFPDNSFGYARINLGIKFWELKITILEALLKDIFPLIKFFRIKAK